MFNIRYINLSIITEIKGLRFRVDLNTFFGVAS